MSTVPQYRPCDVVEVCSFVEVDHFKGSRGMSSGGGVSLVWEGGESDASVESVKGDWQGGVRWALCIPGVVLCDALDAPPHALGVV